MPTPRRLLTSLISISLAIILIITSQANSNAWNTFVNSSQQWGRSFAGLFWSSEIGPVASAEAIQNEMNNWQNWPSSYRLKYFDGGWIMPFDFYDLQPNRPSNYGNEPARAPVFTDINGDGLVDMLFSSTTDTFIQSGSSTISSIGMQQYIALNNGKHFELVYKCRYGSDSQGSSYKYYGDCADTTASQTVIQKHPPRFPVEMILHHEDKLTPVNKTSAMEGNIANSFQVHVDIATPSLEENCHNKNILDTKSCDRSMPRLLDINGDGLQDIILSSYVAERYTVNYPQMVQRKQSMVLYNNGKGFDLDHLCYEIADIDTTGSTSPYKSFGFGTYSAWPSGINPAAQTYYCLLGNE
jgi:hypothetical protein